ncbi:MAG: YhdP family protein [Candidatus Thiodiazotropha sp.]
MLHTAKYLHLKFWQLMAWLVILLAVLLGVLRYALPHIDLSSYAAGIEQVVEEKAGVPLRIGAIGAEIKGAKLLLKLTDVSALDPQTGLPRLTTPKVYVSVRLLASLFSGRLQLGDGRLVGTRLKATHHPDGTITLHGFGASRGTGSGAVTELLLGQNHLRLQDTEILLSGSRPGRPPLHLTGVVVDLINDGLRHQLSVSSAIGDRQGQRIRLVADLRQPDPGSWAMDGKFYFKAENLQLGGRLADWLPPGYRVQQADASLEVWGELAGGRLQQLEGTGRLGQLRVYGPRSGDGFVLSELSTGLRLENRPAGWWLGLDRLTLQRPSERWPSGRLELAWWSPSPEDRGFHLKADYLGLQGIYDFLEILHLPDAEWHNTLLALEPSGDVRALDFIWRDIRDSGSDWQLRAEVEDYASKAWHSIPGIQGVQLVIDGSQSGGWMKLSSEQMVLDYAQLFRQPIHADSVAGDFLWHFDPAGGLRLQTDRLAMNNPDLHTLSRVDVTIPLSGQDLFTDIQTDFWDGRGASKSDYLPVSVMPHDLVEWIDNSVVDGHVTTGSFLLYGPANRFPFKQQEGRFEVWFGVEDLLLDYMPGWPELNDAVAEVHFINNGLQMRLSEGRMLSSRLNDVNLRIDQLRNPTPLQIKGEAAGPFRDLMSILGDTPLRKDFHGFVDAVSVAGDIRTQLDLTIPLETGRGSLRVDGKLTLEQADITLREIDLPVRALEGTLAFDLSGIEGKDLRANLMQRPVRFDVIPVHRQGRSWTRIVSRVALDMKRLVRQFPDWELHNFEGLGEADLAFSIAHQESAVPVRMDLESDLVGVAVNLPEPLGKSAAEPRRLDLGVDFLSDRSTELRIRYGQDTHALWRFYADHQTPWVAAFGFSQEPLSLDGVEGFHLSGAVHRLDADEWVAWVSRQSGDAGRTLPRIAMDLRVDELVALGTVCPNARFTYNNYADGYRVNLTSDTVQGTMQIPGDLAQRPILGRFDYLKLNLQELATTVAGERASEAKAPETLDPRQVPAVNFSVERLYLNEDPIGKGNIIWSKEQDGITINSLTLVGTNIDLTGQGYWRMTPQGHSTALNLQLQTPSLGDLQEELGLTTGIEQAPTEVKAELYWPTSPLQMGADKLYGSLWLKVGKGQVNNVDPGMGRLIGLFSLNALGKRLALDFSDLFSKGMAFDSIEGNFNLNDGDAYTTDLALRSTLASVDIRGRTGLSSRNYDQRVVVIPNVSATLPLVGALAINPSVGVALALTQQLFGKQFDRIAMRTYEVTGSWDNPQFRQLEETPDPDRKNVHTPEMPGQE